MKKSVLIFAFAAIFGFAATAQEPQTLENDPLQTQTEMQQDTKGQTFEEVNVDNVPEAVKNAALKDNTNAVIESAEEKVLVNGEKVYRVKLSGTTTGEETKSYYANGREYKEEIKQD
jgi:hypothetical protein